MSKNQSRLGVTLFVVYALILCGIILFKLPFYSPVLSDGVRIVSWIPFQGSFDGNGALNLREILQNLFVFVPYGLYLSLLKGEWSFQRKLLVVVSTTLVFEILQFIFALGRSDMTDILDNTLGGWLGMSVFAMMERVFRGRTSTIVLLLASIATLILGARFGQLFLLSHFAIRHPAL